MAYSDFAYIYDELMQNADYGKRANYLSGLFKKYGKTPTLMLDLACGTGKFSIAFTKKGVEVIGADMSEDMLSVARESTATEGLDILYLCQSAEELDLYGTVDGAICCLDSLNHITDKRALEKAIAKVSLFLEKDCLFIFDVNTPYKHREVLGNNTFVLESDSVYCVWQNEYDEKTQKTNITLDIFEEEDGVYTRFTEEFSERAYEIEYLKTVLVKKGFEVLGVFDDLTENPLNEKSERAIFVAKKKQ